MTLRYHSMIYPIVLVGTLAVAGLSCKSEAPEPEPDVEPMSTAEYIQEVVYFDQELSTLIDEGCLAESISERLATLDHVNPHDYHKLVSGVEVINTPTPEQLESFHPDYLIQIHYLLNALSNPEFRSEIGRELELDTADTSGEHGGALHLLENGELNVEMLPDESSNPNMHFIGDEIRIGSHSRTPDNSYFPRDPEYTLDILAMFHFHARNVKREKSTALSGNDFWMRGAVFSRFGHGRFNVDLAIVYRKEDKIQKANLDLGIYRY